VVSIFTHGFRTAAPHVRTLSKSKARLLFCVPKARTGRWFRDADEVEFDARIDGGEALEASQTIFRITTKCAPWIASKPNGPTATGRSANGCGGTTTISRS
jgi:hypothetical protein